MSDSRRFEILAWAVAILAAAAFLFPRVLPWSLSIIAAASFLRNHIGANRHLIPTSLQPATVAALLFLGWAAVSVFWTQDAANNILKPIGALLALTGTMILFKSLQTEAKPATRATALGLLSGLAAASIFLCIELVSGKAITKSLIEAIPSLAAGLSKHMRTKENLVLWITNAAINRVVCIQSLMIVPAFAAAHFTLRGTMRKVALAVLAMLLAVIMLFSAHQSSQAALAAGLLTGLASYFSLNSARRLVHGLWAIMCLLIVPLAIAEHDVVHAQNNTALFNSARTRVSIWDAVAREALKHPILGIGAGGSGQSQNILIEASRNFPGATTKQFVALHPHNAYLQIWYEMGAIGAILAFMFGLVVLRWIGGLDQPRQKLWLMQFMVIAIILFPSYSIWQFWLLASISMSVIFLAVAMAAQKDAKPI